MRVTMRQLNILEILFHGRASIYTMQAEMEEAGLNSGALKTTIDLLLWKKWIAKSIDGMGCYVITDLGREAMNGKHKKMTLESLRQFKVHTGGRSYKYFATIQEATTYCTTVQRATGQILSIVSCN